MQKIYAADHVFTGVERLPDHAVIVEDDVIKNVLPVISLPKDIRVDVQLSLLVPAFIDIQIYGAVQKLFSVFPAVDTLQIMHEHCVSGGTHFFLPTAATNTVDVFYKCIDAVKQYRNIGGNGVPGLHLEGPWINKLKRGAHIEALIHSPDIKEVTDLLEYGKDIIKIITLAPEVCSKEVIDLIQSYGIIVSAGHSNATFKEATQFFDDGIHLVTHLFNAMSPLHHREAGLAGAVMQHPGVMGSIIADGYHVDFEVIRMAKRLMDRRLFLITDAVTETSQGAYLHKREGDKFTSNGILSGSAITMIQSIKNCISEVGIDINEALRMASLYPAKALGIDHHYGMIQKGYAAAFAMLDENMNVIEEKV
ncbi:MAG: N-acetylglucosamine-6-phosphate deacetylase [Ginsengibacter sp.]